MSTILLNLSYTGAGASYTKPYDSTYGISAHAQEVIFITTISIIAYISFRVWLSIKKDEKKE